jgi:membrane-bound metal-dependent hydrolase YbcI (DUF457 family)
MPLPISHGLVGASIVAAIHPKPTKRYFAPLLIGAFLANAADFDFIFVFLFQSKAWHRGFTHSILFAFLVCVVFLMFSGKQHIREALAYGLAYASHFLLDYVTTKNGGVELFWFFSSEMWKLDWVALSESPSKMSLIEIIKAIVLEILLFTPLLALTIYLRKYVSRDWSSRKDS